MEADLLSVTLHAQLQQARGKAVEDGAGEEISDLPLTVTEEEVVDPRDLATGLPSTGFGHGPSIGAGAGVADFTGLAQWRGRFGAVSRT
jgi:hypothetical protein